ncbi:hypothetical protein TanjilG_21476 [Lupinus angustifolius]|uniref:Wall-associated receptor kinase galacturonan-binding domain-containing protein n=1 Tax=Lupinus angustifolius TaxID=3871 RepID=A0A4P1QU80_LUPAN|nr:hypothetical protein TanjilG_21476 [Lupinus angustifolius]
MPSHTTQMAKTNVDMHNAKHGVPRPRISLVANAPRVVPDVPTSDRDTHADAPKSSQASPITRPTYCLTVTVAGCAKPFGLMNQYKNILTKTHESVVIRRVILGQNQVHLDSSSSLVQPRVTCDTSKWYQIYCNNDTLEFLSATGTYYKILSIDPNANKLIINPSLIIKDTCYSSDLQEGGLLLQENSLFNISTHNTVMLFNCSDSILLSPLNCSSNSICRQFEEKVEEGNGCMNTLCCHYLKDSAMSSHRIRIRVGGCTAYTSIVDFKPDESIDSWNYGIELQWFPTT